MEQNVNGKKQIGMMVKGLLPFYLSFTFLPFYLFTFIIELLR